MEKIEIEYRSPEWFAFRAKRLGGSDAAAALGLNPYKSQYALWREKTSNDMIILADKINTTYGLCAEKPLADLFALDYLNLFDTEQPKDIIFINGFKMASLDLLLIDKATKKQGFCEIKTINSSFENSSQWANNHIPDLYYCQMLHYFAVCPNLEYGFIKAQFKSFNGEEPYVTTIHRKVLKKDKLNDINYLINREDQFWWYVKNEKQPPTTLYF